MWRRMTLVRTDDFYHPDDGGDTFLRNVGSRTTRRNITDDGILHSHRRENLKSCIALTGWAL
jgi:hypothetical protein